MIKEGDQGNERKTKVICKIAYPAWQAFLGEFVEKVGTRAKNKFKINKGMKREEGREKRKLFPLHRVDRPA